MSYDNTLDRIYSGYREFSLDQDLMPQVHIGDLMAISGGRRAQINKYEADFPVGKGYHVRVKLSFLDLWEVERVFVREGKVTVKEVWHEVYAPEVSRAMYEASCFYHTKEDLQNR